VVAPHQGAGDQDRTDDLIVANHDIHRTGHTSALVDLLAPMCESS
jgi:hypothetical protein